MSEFSSPINPHATHSISLASFAKSLFRNRQLVVQMTKREIIGKYKGSILGFTWSFFNPVLLLTVYTFVFSEIFKSRWSGAGNDENKTQFAMLLFSGIIVFNLFSEVLNRAPELILGNSNYVKKVVFPIEILPIIIIASTLFHSFISLGVLLFAYGIFNGYVNLTAIFLPLVLMPMIVFSMGVAWALASLGVFLRDIRQTIGIFTTILMFLSPIFYPVTAVPEHFRKYIMLNPLTFIIEQARDVLIWGNLPDWNGLIIYMIIAVIIAWSGFAWFQSTRKGFADVL